MSNSNNFRPTQHEIDDVTKRSRKDAFKGSVIGGVGGYAGGSLVSRRLRKARLAGAAVGAIAGHVVGKTVGRHEGSVDTVRSRRALLQNMSERINRLTELSNARLGGDANETESGQIHDETFRMNPARLQIAEKWGWAIAQSLEDDELDDAHAEALTNAVLRAAQKGDSAGGGLIDEAKRQFAAKVGWKAVEAMAPAELACTLMSAQRRGVISLATALTTTDFDLRVRNDQGEFTPGSVSSAAIQRAYAPSDKQRTTGRNVGIATGAAALGGGLLIARRLKKGKLPRLGAGLPKLKMETNFIARNIKAMPFPGGPKKLVGRRRRDQKLLPWTGGAARVIDPRRLAANGPKSGQNFRSPQPQLPVSNFGNLAGSLAEGLIDAAGLGSATSPKKKKKLLVNSDGIFVDDNGVPLDPQPTSFSVSSRLGSAAAKYGPEGLVIGSADLVAERANAAIEARKKRQKKLLRQRGGIEATPAMAGAPTTLSLRAVLTEFSDAKQNAARRRAEAMGATVGGIAGAAAGTFHDQGKPVKVRDLRPGDQIYRRQGPLGAYQHTGVVDETGERIVHRTPGSSVSRSVKPESFVKGGVGPLRRESHSNDLPRAQAARNATRAAGQRQGKYCLVGENCHSASSRIASKGAPGSRQLKKVLGGAAAGAIAGGALVKVLQNRRKQLDNR